jgi:hypothetical protein
MATVTILDKLACIRREIAYRERVYPRLITNKKMSQAAADREIAVMKVIEADYSRSAKMHQPELPIDDAIDDVA